MQVCNSPDITNVLMYVCMYLCMYVCMHVLVCFVMKKNMADIQLYI